MDPKTLEKTLERVLEPIKQALAEVKQDVVAVKQDVAEVKEDLATVKQDVAEVRDTLDNRVLPSIIETEMTLKSYADSYKINKHNIERVDTRLTAVEDHLNIDPPEELKIPHFSAK